MIRLGRVAVVRATAAMPMAPPPRLVRTRLFYLGEDGMIVTARSMGWKGLFPSSCILPVWQRRN